ncbi:NPC intracellular cholesterol transporter 2-like [Ischnura elegans]|uniref:NPC intracellular cholesterol transporter 2-like n=1 Tax=Ischnura elegans TaxID=197161 RepID=UPI001ED88558|nr:NPC intracellular cholesterol transporter 2-like [Ischnura elegans]
MTKTVGYLSLLYPFLLLQIVRSTEILPCEHVSGRLPTEVHIKGCDRLPCIFPRGSNISAEVVFKAPFAATHLIPILNVQLAQVWMTFDAGETNGCESLVGPQCPLEEGVTYTYVRHIPIQDRYPKIRIKIEHELVDWMRRSVFCYRINALVSDKLT